MVKSSLITPQSDERQLKELNDLIGEYKELKFGLTTKRIRGKSGKIINDVDILKNSSIFKNIGNNGIKLNIGGKKKKLEGEFTGLTARQVIDKLKENSK